MDKKEKYINYVVDDMIKKTEIDYDQEKIKYPSHPSHPCTTFLFSTFLSNILSLHLSSPSYSPSSPLPFFSKHVIERYGIHYNDVDIIWKLYKERIESLYKK